ncbi:MAG: hypothetical protein F4106_01900, partial [Gemmatimonadetes bacterium]|nr:hypothetical protein [Gemmatimonadota bacterium]
MRNRWNARSVLFVGVGIVVGAGGAALLLSPRSDTPVATHDPAAMSGMGEDSRAEQGAGERRILYWRAPMDPAYTSDQPGKSPMGMDLVPVYEDEVGADVGVGGGQVAGQGAGIRVSQAFLQNFAVRTAEVRRGALPVSIRTVGILAHNEERVVSVQTKYEGWIEQASVNNVGETVARGDVLFE